MELSIGGSKSMKREKLGYSAHEQLSRGGAGRYSPVHLERIPCPNAARRYVWVGNSFAIGHEEAVW
jgi:hypothetical protein